MGWRLYASASWSRCPALAAILALALAHPQTGALKLFSAHGFETCRLVRFFRRLFHLLDSFHSLGVTSLELGVAGLPLDRTGFQHMTQTPLAPFDFFTRLVKPILIVIL